MSTHGTRKFAIPAKGEHASDFSKRDQKLLRKAYKAGLTLATLAAKFDSVLAVHTGGITVANDNDTLRVVEIAEIVGLFE